MPPFLAILMCVCLLSPTAAWSAGDAMTAVDRSEIVPSLDSLHLAFPGVKGPIPYEKYGRFEHVGTAQYAYRITDRAGLAKAAGEGLFPNTDFFKDPKFRELSQQGLLKENQWQYVDTSSSALNFYKWASAPEDPGVKQFFSAIMMERCGLIEEAVKGYYAVALHFPRTVSYTYFNTPWYVAPAALDRMEQLLRRHPDLHMRWIPGKFSIPGKYGLKAVSAPFPVDPGRLVSDPKGQTEKPVNLSKLKVIKTVGGPTVQLRQYANHHWQLFVKGEPFTIRAITYSVTPVGLSPDRGTWNVSKDWQLLDTNHNGIHDSFFESYVDKNGNNKRDPDEPVIGDAQLLKDLGINTLRAYHHLYDKELFRKLYKDYGFYVLCGDILGGYAVDSGASWEKGTDYRDPAQQERMLAGVRKMVEDYKDEPYILMWVLGNETVYGVGTNAQKEPEAYFAFVERAVQLIHSLDPTRPVALANGDLLFLDVIARECPHLDVMGANVYRSDQGFGRSLFQDVRDALDRPILITEYGVPAFAEGFPQDQAEAFQALYLANNWEDLEAHHAGRGVGNTLGGVLFEFIDEWWKGNSDIPERIQKARPAWYAPRAAIYKNLQPENHDTVPQFGGPYLDGWSYEEWLGIVSQGNGKDSPFERQLRPAYYRMKRVWNPG